MKVKIFVLTALMASMVLVSCEKKGPQIKSGDDLAKSVSVRLPNISRTASTKAIGDAMAEGQIELKNYKVFFLDAGGNEVVVPEYDGNPQKVYFSSEDGEDWDSHVGTGNAMTYHFLPASTVKVVVVGNYFDEDATYESFIAEGASDKAVDNDNEDGHPLYPLYGEADLTPKTGVDDEEHANIYVATVNLVPRVARVEIYGFEYQLADPEGEWTFESVKLDKIALANYYENYNIIDGDPIDDPVVAPTNNTEKWDWIQNAAAPWADTFSDFVIAQEEKLFADKTEVREDYTGNGSGLEAIFTYNVVASAEASDNPELLLSFFGQNTDADPTPLYLHGKFTDSPAFEAGKIYRVFYPILDAVWEQPERCVELEITVAEWSVVVVTPSFGS